MKPIFDRKCKSIEILFTPDFLFEWINDRCVDYRFDLACNVYKMHKYWKFSCKFEKLEIMVADRFHENDLIDLIISTQQNFLCYQANQSKVGFCF